MIESGGEIGDLGVRLGVNLSGEPSYKLAGSWSRRLAGGRRGTNMGSWELGYMELQWGARVGSWGLSQREELQRELKWGVMVPA